MKTNIRCKVYLILVALLLGSGMAYAQFSDSSTGLQQVSNESKEAESELKSEC